MESRLTTFIVPTKSCAPGRAFPGVYNVRRHCKQYRGQAGTVPRTQGTPAPIPGHPSPGPAPPPSGTRRGHGAAAGPRPSRETRLAALGIEMTREVGGNEGRKREPREARRERPHLSCPQGPSAPPAALPLQPRYSACAGDGLRTAGGAGQTPPGAAHRRLDWGGKGS